MGSDFKLGARKRGNIGPGEEEDGEKVLRFDPGRKSKADQSLPGTA
jgi:hypothetical protein